MTPLTLGKQDTLVYVEGSSAFTQQPSPYTLKRYNVSTRTTTTISSLGQQDVPIVGAQVSADGQWVIFDASVSGQRAIQLVRVDGQELQTLYCSANLSPVQLSPDNKYVAFVEDSGGNPTFTLLTLATGAIQTRPRDSAHGSEHPLGWLDSTHLYVVPGTGPGETIGKLSLLDITTGISKQMSSPASIDMSLSVDRTQLFTSQFEAPNGPSNIQVEPATGGVVRTSYSTATDTITTSRVVSNTSMLLAIHNANKETGHNGLWKLNTDGTELTRLISESAYIKDPAHEMVGFANGLSSRMDQPWANASRDGALYSIVVFVTDNSGMISGPDRTMVGSMNGGAPVAIARGLR
jgi:hypothetical protein